MASMTLIVDRRGTQLDLAGSGVVRVRYDNDETHRVGLYGLRSIILQGDVQVSSALLRACSKAGVGLVLSPGRGGGETVHLFPAGRRSVALHLAQFRCFETGTRRMSLARKLVAAKIAQQAIWLSAHGTEVPLQRFIDQAYEAPSLAVLMGIEGAATARYFSSWRRLWKEPWSFRKRNRRPPQDPINALLSLGYALALNYTGRIAALRGLDLAVGFLHGPEGGRPSLALDLLEPVRPRVDQWVWQLLHGGRLNPDDFTYSPMEGCRLTKQGRAVFFNDWYASEDDCLQRPARNALALVLRELKNNINQGDEGV